MVKPRGSSAKARKPSCHTSPNAVENEQAETSKGDRQLQQKCLKLFQDAFAPNLEDSTTLQEVKGHLYRRDFETAFSKPEYLTAYTSRWSPSRALCYLQVLQDLYPLICRDENDEVAALPTTIACLGGGAGAEIVALAAWYSLVCVPKNSHPLWTTMIDIADWREVVAKLSQRVVTAPEISKYATAAAKEANIAMLAPDQIRIEFLQQDVLSWTDASLQTTLVSAGMVTLLFTLNELYTGSLAKTQDLLARMTAVVRPGSFLLVVDSPGSYSTVSINGTDKRYPMKWLLDIALLGPPEKAGVKKSEAKWEQLLSDDSRWFRIPSGLVYPIELESMRYQIHLYRRTQS